MFTYGRIPIVAGPRGRRVASFLSAGGAPPVCGGIRRSIRPRNPQAGRRVFSDQLELRPCGLYHRLRIEFQSWVYSPTGATLVSHTSPAIDCKNEIPNLAAMPTSRNWESSGPVKLDKEGTAHLKVVIEKEAVAG